MDGRFFGFLFYLFHEGPHLRHGFLNQMTIGLSCLLYHTNDDGGQRPLLGMTMATSQKEMGAMGIRGRERSMGWMMWLLWLFGVLQATGGVQAQAGETPLTLWLRDSQGTAVAGESLLLVGMPEELGEPAGCVTDAEGGCTWSVRRGIYQVIFSRPLDPVSALAVAEGGLRGLGVTVGDTAVAYHFTFHSDGRVYFDAAPETAAPEAAVPKPLIPTGEMLHGGVATLVTATPAPTVVLTTVPTPRPVAPELAARPTTGQMWRMLFFIGGGALVAFAVQRYFQRQFAAAAAEQTKQAEQVEQAERVEQAKRTNQVEQTEQEKPDA
jgi:hypothetical protein